MMLFLIGATAGCYYFFNQEFFKCVARALGVKTFTMKCVITTFVINYSAFYLCSLLEFHLIVNWLVFLILVIIEIHILYKSSILKAGLLSLLGTQLGLSINILLRSLFALVLDIPLIAFDSQVSLSGNMKVYPSLLGFLVGAIIFGYVYQKAAVEKLQFVLKDRRNLVFLLSLLLAMYLYLCMNLIVYYIPDNILVIKLWSMKSSVFVIVGEHLAIILAIEMAQLNNYRKENYRVQQILEEEKLHEQELRMIAITDPLTGCANRAEINKQIVSSMNAKSSFIITFVDLDRLKQVNDTYGHESGDIYLLSVCHALQSVCRSEDVVSRYGGDEFIVIFKNMTKEEAHKQLQIVQNKLLEMHQNSGYPFSMSISYGFAGSDEADTLQTLIEKADASMYQMKQTRYNG